MPGNEPARSRKLTKTTSPRHIQPNLVQFTLMMTLTTTMVATGGFGALPPNQLTNNAASLLSENLPAEMIEPINLVLEQVAAPTLDVIERPVSSNNNPVVELFESLVEPIFTALPEALTEVTPTATIPEASPTNTENPTTATLEVNITTTETIPPSPSITLTTPTQPPSPTPRPSSTATLAPTWTFVYIPPTPTKTLQPPPEDTETPIPATPSDTPTVTGTPTITGTPIVTTSPSPVPAGHLITSVSLNGGGSSITAIGGATVTVDYAYQVWGDSSTCPGCNLQLIWALDNNWQTCFQWSPSPGDYPGVSGTSLASGMTVNITAPTSLGTYTIYSFAGQYPDCSAAIAAYASSSATFAGQITVANSCAAGLNLIHTAPFSLTDAFEARWNGTNWNFATIPNWGTNLCNLPTYNNSGVDIAITARTANNICQSLTVPAFGGVAWISGDNTLGQCPVELYTP